MSQPNFFDEPILESSSSEELNEISSAPVIDNVMLEHIAPNGKHGTAPNDEHGIPPVAEALSVPFKKTIVSDGIMPKRVVLIDGHALAYRSYYALQRSSGTLQTSKGEPTQAIYGFIKTMLRFLRDGGDSSKKTPAVMRLQDARTHAVIVVFDPPVKTFRHEMFADYKAGRAETPSDLPDQIRKIKTLVDLMGLVRLEVNGFEADDVIGTLSTRAQAEGMDVRILTSDRDAYQLLSDKVRVIASDYSEVTPADVFTKYGVTVEQWVDYRALTGDSSDNIPGARGIGPKGAQKLLAAYGSLQFILDNLDSLKDKEAQKIRDSFENVLFSKELSQIVTTVDLDVDFTTAKVYQPDVEALTQMLRELELHSFVRDLGLEAPGNTKLLEPREPVLEVTLGDWVAPDASAVYGFVLSNDNPVTAQITALAYADPRTDWIVRETPSPTLDLLSKNIVLHGADAKALAVHAISRGVQAEPGHDPILMAYCIDPGNAEPSRVAQRYLNVDWPKDAVGRANASAKLLQKLPSLMVPEIQDLYEKLEQPASVVLAKMEARGILIDVPFFKTMSDSAGVRIAALELEIWELAGEQFNLNSRDKLEVLLYDTLALEAGKKLKTTGKRSTAVGELEKLRDVHPIINKILEYRELAKLRGTYLDPLPLMVSAHTGRLHTTFSQTVAATGRLSSLNPNLQNIPIRTEVGREIRKGFIAPPGMKLISADYSQIELRILAHITAEPALIEGFQNNEDIHKRTAATILNVPLESVTIDQRRGAKTINYGVLYGMSAHRLANDMGMEYASAKQFIEAYFGAYPGIGRYLEQTKAFCREHGYVQDLFGRRRYMSDVNSKIFAVREAAERAAINMPIQGTSAGIIKRAMIDLEPQLEQFGARLLLQVHDELVVECPDAHTAVVSAIVRDTMGHAFDLKVPLGAEVGVGLTWYDAH